MHPYLERREKLRKDPSFRVPYEHPSLEPILADTLGDDRLPGAGDPGGHGAGGVQRRRGRGAAPGDEPQALRGGDPGLSRSVHRRGERAGRDAGGGGARLRADPRLLGVRVPEGPRGRLWPARLPVDLASGPLRTRVPLLAPERAADGLLPARRAGPRGAAEGDRGAAAGRQPQRRGVLGRAPSGQRTAGGPGPTTCRLSPVPCHPRGADRPGLHNRPAGGRRPGARRRAPAPRPLLPTSPTSRRAPAWAARGSSSSRGPGRARGSAGGTTCGDARICGGSASPGAGGGLGPAGPRAAQMAPPHPSRAHTALPPPPHSRGALAARARLVGAAGRRLRAPSGSRSPSTRCRCCGPSLEHAVASSADLDGVSDGRPVEIAGMVVARQRPATARGVVFMLLEDELGTINVVVPPPVYRRHRLAVRTASFARVSGKPGATRPGSSTSSPRPLRPIATPDQPRADVRHIEPPAERETGRRIAGGDADRAGALSAGQAAELAAVDAGRPQLRPPRAMTPGASSLAEHMFRLAALLPCASMSHRRNDLGQRTRSAASISRSTSRRWASTASCRPPRTGPVASEPTGDPEPIAGLAGRRWRRPAAAPVERQPRAPAGGEPTGASPAPPPREPTSAPRSSATRRRRA